MMRQRKNLFRALLALALGLCMAVLCSLPFSAMARAKDSSLRVDDGAGLFTSEESKRLEERISALREEMNMDVAVVTTADAQGMTSEEYADWYYEVCEYGVGKNHSGVLLLLDMDNRQLFVSTEGAMIRFLTDGRIESMMDHAIPYMQSNDSAGAANQMLDDVLAFYRKGIPGGQYNYDRETGAISRHRSIRWYEGLMAFAAAAFCGAGACLSVKKEYAMQQEQQQAANYHMAYRANAQFHYQNQNDVLADQFVVQSLIASAMRGAGGPGGGVGHGGGGMSTTHTSAGGHTHGGGGRGF